MKIIATQKFVRMSPRKLRLVADMVRDLEPQKAIDVLPYVGKRAAFPLIKVIKTALANAKDRGVTGQLSFSEIQISEGPRLKRGRPVSRGAWHPYKRRMSHIRMVLQEVKPQIPSVKGRKSSNLKRSHSKIKNVKAKLPLKAGKKKAGVAGKGLKKNKKDVKKTS